MSIKAEKPSLGSLHHQSHLQKLQSELLSGKTTFKFTCYIPTKMHHDFKMKCLKTKQSMTEVTQELIEGWLKE